MKLLRITLFALAAALTASAQAPMPGMGPGGPMGGSVNLAAAQTYLGLSADQMATLESLRMNAQEESQPVFEAMRTKMQAGDANASTTAQKEIAAIREKYRTQAVAVLTDAQRTKLAALEEAAKLLPTITAASALNLLSTPNQGLGMGGMGRGGASMMPMGPRQPRNRQNQN